VKGFPGFVALVSFCSTGMGLSQFALKSINIGGGEFSSRSRREEALAKWSLVTTSPAFHQPPHNVQHFLRWNDDGLRRTGVAPVSIFKCFNHRPVLLVRPGETRTQGGNARVRDGRDACTATRKRNRRHDGDAGLGGRPGSMRGFNRQDAGAKRPGKTIHKIVATIQLRSPDFLRSSRRGEEN
jgi:hypothetical protein